MSVIVAMLGHHGVALATDSVHIDLPTGRWGTGYVKHVQVGTRAGAFAGLSDVSGQQVATWLTQALRRANTLADVTGEFIQAAGPLLTGAYSQWRTLVGHAVDASEFLQVLVVGSEGGSYRAVEIQAGLSGSGGVALFPTYYGPADNARVLVAGAIDYDLMAHSDVGRMVRFADMVQLGDSSIPAVPDLSAHLTADQYEQHARRLVEAVLSREEAGGRLQLPDGWPAVVPTVAGPVHAIGF